MNSKPLAHHPREFEVAAAKLKIQRAFLDAATEHGLTPAESAAIFAELIQTQCMYMIRHERHGSYETPGGLQS